MQFLNSHPGIDYLPYQLPCGKKVNQHWMPEKEMECCKTECPGKSINQIESCYKSNKHKVIKKEKTA